MGMTYRASPKVACESAMKSHFIMMAPNRITHMFTFTFGRDMNPFVFNRQHCQFAAKINRVIIDTLDDLIYRSYGVKRIPRADRLPFVSKGETRSKLRGPAHLHFHVLLDLGDDDAVRRFQGLKAKFKDRLYRKLEKRFGLRVRFHCIKLRPGSYSHIRITDYLAKEILVDLERIWTRQSY
jgi:hypothetical protein